MDNENKKLERADKISAWRLCMGCGACKWTCPNKAITLKNVVELGIRPVVDESKCEKCGKCAEICPGIDLRHGSFSDNTISELRNSWGPVLDIFEGHASEDEIRMKGSSGGAVTALALYLLEKEKVSR
jgi:coenzyme F420 hydrogenase subunit beta